MPAVTERDTDWMRHAIRLAMRGRGDVEPNPMVGCVIVKNDRLIGEGWHRQNGGPHAEPTALAACKESPLGATAYVTLEPCCHVNKRTPPCAPRLIKAKVSRVVVGCDDPNPEVAGRGIAQLRAAGIVVDVGICEAEAKQLAAPFLLRMAGSFARPYLTLKWAQTADGKIAGANGSRLQISNEMSSLAVHQLRGRCDAIMVGIQTVLMDDPMLTPRGVAIHRPLLRIVADTMLRTPLVSKLAVSARKSPLRIYCSPQVLDSPNSTALRSLGVDVRGLPVDPGQCLSLPALLADLSPGEITHLLVEPGPTLARALFGQNIVDRLWMIRSPRSVDDASGPVAASIPPHFLQTGTIDLAGDSLTEYLNTTSPVFFTNSPSADFVKLSGTT